MKRAAGLSVALLAGVVVGSFGDDVWVDKLPYRNVTVVDVRAGKLIFLLGGRRLEKPLENITRVRLQDNADLNKAEGLLAEGKRDEALAAYRQALTRAGRPWQKTLIQQRRETAQKLTVPPASSPATIPKPSPKARCYYCGGTGWMPCPTCRAGGRNTGLGRCSECKGKGYITCPECKGETYKQSCPRCRGTGQVVIGTQEVGAFVRKIHGKCPDCEAGYLDYCWRCKDRPKKLRGTIVCTKCKGTGIFGKCATCKGSRRVPCSHCDAGKKRIEEFKRFVLTTSAPADTPPAGDAASVWVLSTPKTFVDSRPKEPDYKKMTTLQWAMAAKEYREKLHGFRRRYLGKEVRWPVMIEDIAPVGDEGDVALVGVSPGKVRVRAVFSKEHVAELAKYSKGHKVVVAGEIDLSSSDEDKPLLIGPDGSVKLKGRGIVTSGPKTP